MRDCAAALQILGHWGEHAGVVITFLLDQQGKVVGIDDVVSSLGFQNRHQLARILRRSGTPPFEELRAWIQVFTWVVAWEEAGLTLERSAYLAERDPRSCYRTVRRVTQLSWSVLRHRGSIWLLNEMANAGSATREMTLVALQH